MYVKEHSVTYSNILNILFFSALKLKIVNSIQMQQILERGIKYAAQVQFLLKTQLVKSCERAKVRKIITPLPMRAHVVAPETNG